MLKALIEAIDQLIDNKSIDYNDRLDWACVSLELIDDNRETARAMVLDEMDPDTRELLLKHYGDDFAVRRAAGELLGVVA